MTEKIHPALESLVSKFEMPKPKQKSDHRVTIKDTSDAEKIRPDQKFQRAVTRIGEYRWGWWRTEN